MAEQENLLRGRVAQFLDSYLKYDHTVRKLLLGKEDILVAISNEVDQFSESEIKTLVGLLLDGLSRDNAYWTQDRRDAVVQILSLTDYDKMAKENLFTLYLRAVKKLKRDSDPYGPASSLLEAGTIIAPSLAINPGTTTHLYNAWTTVVDRYSGDERRYVRQHVIKLITQINEALVELAQPQNDKLGERKEPNFEENEKVLHDLYLQDVRRNGSFKITLWENTPLFRKECQKVSLDLARFWNINNPDAAVMNLNMLTSSTNSLAKTAFDRHLQKTTGQSLLSISQDLARVVADELHTAAIRGARDLVESMGDFDQIMTKFRNLLHSAKALPPRAQRAVVSQVGNFFQANGVSKETQTIQEALRLVLGARVQKVARQNYQKKQGEKWEAALFLQKTFKDRQPEDFRLISRAREDLYLGDLTGDCTAYHLNVGVNAWTLPIWLCNPGFTIFRIFKGDNLLAKLGIALALERNTLVLVVDSIEVGKNAEREEEAVGYIKDGFAHLKDWAKSIGITKVMLNNVSNSSDVAHILKGITRFGQQRQELTLLGGLSGVSELRTRLLGQNIQERIYLQSAYFDEDQDQPSENNTNTLVNEFEKTIKKTLEKSTKEEVEIIEKATKDLDWKTMFGYILEKNFSSITPLLGMSWSVYKSFLDQLSVKELGAVYPIVNGTVYESSDPSDYPIAQSFQEHFRKQQESEPIKPEREPTSEEQEARRQYYALNEELLLFEPDSIEAINDTDDIDEDEASFIGESGYLEALQLDSFLVLLKELEFSGLSPEQVLQRLYGETQATPDTNKSANSRILLVPWLPELAIPNKS